MKKLWFLLAGLFVGFFILIGLAYFFLGSLIKKGIETLGPQMTQTSVGVGLVSISPFSGRAGISRFNLGNPEGFKSPAAIKFQKFQIVLQPNSLLKDIVQIQNILIVKPEIWYETISKGNNIERIQKNVEQFQTKLLGTSKSTNSSSSSSPTKKFFIQNILIQDATVHWSPQILGEKNITLSLPEIRLQNFGTEKEGMALSQVISKVLGGLISGIGKETAKLGRQKVVQEVKHSAKTAAQKGLQGFFK